MNSLSILPILDDFLNIVVGQKEVGLIITKDHNELVNLATVLNAQEFKESQHIADFISHPKIYSILSSDTAKNFYDFAVQYPTGQVEIFDSVQMRSQITAPDYHTTTILFLVTKAELGKLEKQGFNFLSIVGPTYQSQ